MRKHSFGPDLLGALKARLRRIKAMPAGPETQAVAGPIAAAQDAPHASHGRGAAPGRARLRRFLSDKPVAYDKAIAAAETYVSLLPSDDWLYCKPYDPSAGHEQYFRLMYDLLNMLKVMQLPTNARILEVGSGPGWITEILLMLGHEVDALEPSADMITVARERCRALEHHFRFRNGERVRFHENTVEHVEFAPDSFDAVLYFDVLHHVVDERVAIEKTFQFLRPGGCVGVVESAWHPDFKELEAILVKEMQTFGTLENPFSVDYLDELLRNAGFVSISRYAGVNGFFNASELKRPLSSFAPPLHALNNIVALKPVADDAGLPSCDNLAARTDVRFELLDGGLDTATFTAGLTVRITNRGETLLDNRAAARTRVTIALRRGAPGTREFIEARERHLLAQVLKPGESVTMTVQFSLPHGAPLDGWELDAVAEGRYWFSSRGITGLGVGPVSA